MQVSRFAYHFRVLKTFHLYLLYCNHIIVVKVRVSFIQLQVIVLMQPMVTIASMTQTINQYQSTQSIDCDDDC
jgi:hypothetical protein